MRVTRLLRGVLMAVALVGIVVLASGCPHHPHRLHHH